MSIKVILGAVGGLWACSFHFYKKIFFSKNIKNPKNIIHKMEVKIHYKNIKSKLIERTKDVQLKEDAHLADLVRFLQRSIPKVKKTKK